jgi:hypothetical protein
MGFFNRIVKAPTHNNTVLDFSWQSLCLRVRSTLDKHAAAQVSA